MDAALTRLAAIQGERESGLAVVKLGGSVVRSGALVPWLEVLASSPRPVIVVPGGGALADEVRSCQRDLGFGDAAAHRMALLAMDQLAWAVAGVRPGFEVGTTEQSLREILIRGHVAVWAPSALIAGRADIEESWQLTSDSLALWLANTLEAPACYLIKSVIAKAGAETARRLAQDGVIDEAFPAMLAESGMTAMIFGQGDQPALAAVLAGAGDGAGVVIE
jgi:aspartokinase-like uncharacterized kinase